MRSIYLFLFCTTEAMAGFTNPVSSTPVELARPSAIIYTSPRNAERMLSLTSSIPQYNLHGLERGKILAFAKNARTMKLPQREYNTEIRAKFIAQKYSAALHPKVHQEIRTVHEPKLWKVEIPDIKESSFLLLVRRLDSLFLLQDNLLADAVAELWALSNDKENSQESQASDALFSAIAAKRQGWIQSASMNFSNSLDKGIQEQPKYFSILWTEIAELPSVYLDLLTEKMEDLQQEIALNFSNSATFLSFAKQHSNAEVQKLSTSTLANTETGERLSLLLAIRYLQEQKLHDANILLEKLVESTHPFVRKEAIHNLARLLLLQEKFLEAAALYKSVGLDSKNKDQVLFEMAFAEWKSGNTRGSLGKTIGLQSPYFLYAFLPDAPLLEAYSRKALCDFGGAQQALERFRNQYGSELTSMESLEKIKEEQALYREMVLSVKQENPLRYQRYILHLPPIHQLQNALNDIHKEQIAVQQQTQGKYTVTPQSLFWTDFLQSLEVFQAIQEKNWIQKFEKISHEELAVMRKNLLDKLQVAELLALDVSSQASENHTLQAALNYPLEKKAEEASLNSLKSVRWPYEKEVWEDELEFLKVTNPSKCAKQQIAGSN